MKFHLIRAGKRPLLALPSGRNGWLADAARYYPGHTWKKRLLRSFIRNAAGSGLLKLLNPVGEPAIPGIEAERLGPWLDEIRRKLGDTGIQPIIVWPGDPARGRLYIHLLNSDGDARAFCKLALDRHNSDLIRHEADTLARLASLKLRLSRVPSVIASGTLGESEFLVTSHVPSDARASDWRNDRPLDSVIAECSGEVKTLSAEDIKHLPWWQALLDAYEDRSLMKDALNDAICRGVQVCRVHGDMNRTNVLRLDDQVWLLDWERSQEAGPALTDRVCVEVDTFWLVHPGDGPGNLLRFRKKFIDNKTQVDADQALLALAYLGSIGFPPAQAIIDAWFP